VVYGDLRDINSLREGMEGCDRVYHCAAKLSTVHGGADEQREIFDCNVAGTQNVLLAARDTGVKRVVVSGSFSATGYHLAEPSRPAAETVPFYPFSRPMPYEQSKALVEHECLRAFAEGQDVVVATSCAILGPNDYKPSRMGKVLCDFSRGRLHAYIPGGFEFVAARDIVEGHVLAMRRGRAGQKYIFSTRFLTLDDLMGYYEEVTGKSRPRLRLPATLMAGLAEISSLVMTHIFPQVPQRLTPGAVRILRMLRHADCSKAKEELGYQPSSILEAIHEAYEDFVRRGLIMRAKVAVAVPGPQPVASGNGTRGAVAPKSPAWQGSDRSGSNNARPSV